ncbi:MAG: hypothetical protein K2X35_06140 [Bryobacteraceae bacterium]|nr:hypothetical protein [Bryobacteraceae bacterium]
MKRIALLAMLAVPAIAQLLTPMAQKTRARGLPTWDPAWDQFVIDALPPEMLSDKVPADVRTLCPRFFDSREDERKQFWAYLFQAMAAAESSFRLNARLLESHLGPDSVTGSTIVSEGLLQLSYQDARMYGCGFDWELDQKLGAEELGKSVFDPKRNLECGVKILSTQIIRRARPLFTEKSYWAIFRPSRPGHKIFLREMANTPGFCRADAGPKP